MLTKQEREEIAERLNKCEVLGELYYAVIGEELPTVTSYEQDIDAIFTRLSDLCDTSNMIELPVDKDGEVIHAGDTVYGDDNVKYEVAGYMVRGNSTEVILAAGAEPVYTKEPANNITHKKPVTIASLAKQIKNVLDDDGSYMPNSAFFILLRIVDQLESLGDSDDD